MVRKKKERIMDIEEIREILKKEDPQTFKFYIEILEGKRKKEEILKILCFQNLAYCCALQKPCPYRDLALITLNIDPELYKKVKDNLKTFFCDTLSLIKLNSLLEFFLLTKKKKS